MGKENDELKDYLYYNDLINELKGLIIGREDINERIKLINQDIESGEKCLITERQLEYARELSEILKRVKSKQQLGESCVLLLREEIKVLNIKKIEAIFRDNPVVKEHPAPNKKYTPHESHNGFVEWQPISERYEVPGLMPRAPRELHPKLVKKKKPEAY